MAWLDFSSKSTSETFAPTVGGQSTSGNVAPVVVTGDKSSHGVTINQSDQGAIAGGLATANEAINGSRELGVIAGQIADRSLTENAFVADTAIRTGGDIFRDAVGFGQGILDGAAGLVRDALQESSYQQERAIMAAESAFNNARAVTGEAIDSNTQISRDSIDLSRSVVDLTESLNQQNIDYQEGVFTQGVGFLANTVEDVTSTFAASDASRAQETQQNLAAITELATAVQTGGESINANVNKAIAALAIAMGGFVAWRALK